MENINAGKALHRAFSVFLFNSKYELLLQVFYTLHYLKFTNGCCIGSDHDIYVDLERKQDCIFMMHDELVELSFLRF